VTRDESLGRADRPRAAGRPAAAGRDAELTALDLIRRYGRLIFATARRYSLTPEDAEDAYQRSLEILLTKAPSTEERELLPWLKTVVKHEAFATRRQRERAEVMGEETLQRASGFAASPHEQAERYERLQMGAEAIRRLKPQEIRCLLLRAEGYSYRQICEETGWTYTKVNRCLTEGRRSFLANVAGIEAGVECERLAPLLSALADGEATSQDLLALRPHLRSCLTCRATLRRFRAVPGSITALVPAAAVAGEPDLPTSLEEAADAAGGGVHRGFDSLTTWLHDRGMTAGLKAQQAIELATTSKVAAVAASTAALAGGGVATIGSLEEGSARPADRAQHSTPGKPHLPRTPPTRALPPLPREADVAQPAPATVAAAPIEPQRPVTETPRREQATPSAQSPLTSSPPESAPRRSPPEGAAPEESADTHTTSDGDFGL
jgi:RNA polymerase sigma factor (sigma-70 family)